MVCFPFRPLSTLPGFCHVLWVLILGVTPFGPLCPLVSGQTDQREAPQALRTGVAGLLPAGGKGDFTPLSRPLSWQAPLPAAWAPHPSPLVTQSSAHSTFSALSSPLAYVSCWTPSGALRVRTGGWSDAGRCAKVWAPPESCKRECGCKASCRGTVGGHVRSVGAQTCRGDLQRPRRSTSQPASPTGASPPAARVQPAGPPALGRGTAAQASPGQAAPRPSLWCRRCPPRGPRGRLSGAARGRAHRTA